MLKQSGKPPKILYLITRAERGGAQVHVLDLLKGFRDRCQVEVAAGEDGYLMDEARKLGVACHVVPSLYQPMHPITDTRACFEILGLLRRTQPDLLHVHTSKAGVLGRLAARWFGIPSVFTAHTWCFAEGTSRWWRLAGAPFERMAAWTGASIINVSEANRKLALQYRIAPAERLVTIHNGIPDMAAPRTETRSEPPVVLMVARFAPQKNQAMLLEALARVKSMFRVQFAGDGPTRAGIERLAGQLGLTSRVDFLGDRSDIAAVLERASIFALPTNWEGFPLSILEAMRAGLPVVANDVGGVSESVTDGVNGFLVPRGDTPAMAVHLERLLANPELRLRMGQASRQAFQQNFTLQSMLTKTSEIYTRALAAARYPTFSEGKSS